MTEENETVETIEQDHVEVPNPVAGRRLMAYEFPYSIACFSCGSIVPLSDLFARERRLREAAEVECDALRVAVKQTTEALDFITTCGYPGESDARLMRETAKRAIAVLAAVAVKEG